MSLLPGYRKSFFMGQQRPDGLRLKMKYRKGLVYTDVNVSDAFQGYEGVVHGGMLFGILDVLMWYAIFIEERKVCMTRKTDMDFFKPVLCDKPYRAQGKLLRVEDRDVWATGWIEGGDREKCAQVTALFREAKGVAYQDVVNRMDFTDVSLEVRKLLLSPPQG
jgi:acyl-coenzyme A thioesterase PaaI-like protein